ncbi:glutathione S-transferase family protein [Marinicella meishanensis]|uniref:glutathione S-transferase family protein n=1 Tax=Marinicella meishanensis TaxID=2873263 RepID=UPI001CC15285|nr:glutathione S-transferase family protein [Marinicella sp. NBU2979]
MITTHHRVLYSGTRNASSWAFRAWLALQEQAIEFEEVIVDIRRPQRWRNLAEIGRLSPPAAVPVLVDDGVVIHDSLAIMEYANELGTGELLPTRLSARAQVRSWVAWQHAGLGQVCPALSFESAFYPHKKTLSSSETQQAEWLYGLWEQGIQQHQGLYLVGAYSLADIALLPTVLRLTSHLAVPDDCPHVQTWVQALLERPLVKSWLDEAHRCEPIYLPGYQAKQL